MRLPAANKVPDVNGVVGELHCQRLAVAGKRGLPHLHVVLQEDWLADLPTLHLAKTQRAALVEGRSVRNHQGLPIRREEEGSGTEAELETCEFPAGGHVPDVQVSGPPLDGHELAPRR